VTRAGCFGTLTRVSLFPRLAFPALALTSVALAAGLLGGSSAASPLRDLHPLTGPVPAAAAAAAAKPAQVVVVAVGDISCTPGAKRTATTCRDGRTAKLTAALDPDAVLALGDLQYERGSLHGFRHAYADTWGKLLGKTYPIPGNHEYKTADARGYYTYFAGRQPGAPGYYAFDLGGWRVYALNSNCGVIDCAKEYEWLEDDLTANPRTCSLFTMHHPRFSSGLEHGANRTMSRFFRIAVTHDVEMVLAGHDHDYERFHRMKADGTRDRDGVLSFVSGAGGKSLYGFGTVQEGSAYRRAGHFGVLRLALRSDEFRFAFKDVNGTTPDAGTRACR
jgi:acid phosphatase type 7